MTRRGYVYILTNKPHGSLYIGVTSNLELRLSQHSISTEPSFVDKYKLHRLVYVEKYPTILEAITREKQLKRWHRPWKINLIEQFNPTWNDIIRDPETSSG
jgi:putative endonuclease